LSYNVGKDITRTSQIGSVKNCSSANVKIVLV